MTTHPFVAAAPTVKLANGVDMPTLGLGTWPMNDTQAAEAVSAALDIGYRLIDTAENYRNEVGVGEGIRRSKIPREEVFLTTKFNREWHSVEGARLACEASLKRLGLDYIDLLLIHWPNPDQDRYVDAFHGLVKLVDAGLVRAIGTSNFKTTHLQKLFDAGLVPHVNQIQLDPMHARDDIVAVHKGKGIITETWSPLGRGSALLSKPVIADIAKRVGRTEAQVVLRWHAEQGFIPTPKSSDPKRQAENLNIFDFTLTAADIAAISALNEPDAKMEDSDIFGH